MKVVFCGGGTGGHVTPALAIGDILRQNIKDLNIHFIGRVGGGENNAAIKAGYKLHTIDVQGIMRRVTVKNLVALKKAITAEFKVKKLLREIKPDLVIGTGGYVCWPTLRASISLKIPTLIHESNSYPGLVTRTLGKKCSRVMLSSEKCLSYLKHRKNAFVTGNPVPKEFKETNRKAARSSLGLTDKHFFILSFGGSLGAAKINEAVTEVIKSFSLKTENVIHIHATGKNEYEKYRHILDGIKNTVGSAKIIPYIEDMPTYLHAADVVIARSGAMTISEIRATKTPAILIPSPYVTENHQYLNAKDISDCGGAILLEESALCENVLKQRLDTMYRNRDVLKKMSESFGDGTYESTAKAVMEAVRLALRTKVDRSNSAHR